MFKICFGLNHSSEVINHLQDFTIKRYYIEAKIGIVVNFLILDYLILGGINFTYCNMDLNLLIPTNVEEREWEN